MSFLTKHLNDPFYIEGTTRVSVRSKIFRELVANIIAHREYMSPQPAFINIFKESIEFKNPNNPSVFGKIDPKHFVPVAKNPTINKLMIQLGRAEDIGSGIRNVIKYLPHYAEDATVEFIDGESFSTIIQFNDKNKNISTEGEKVGEKVGETERKILALIGLDKYITYKILSYELKISEKSIFKNIEKLKQKGLLKRIGPTKGGYWKIVGN